MLPRLQSLTKINQTKITKHCFLNNKVIQILALKNAKYSNEYNIRIIRRCQNFFYFNLLCYNVGNVYVTGQTIFPSVSQFINKTPL